ncbi:hypothetical protein JWZ98_08940 [Methylomonas sp. EFPC1]|uniref:hypothetical protein n=1 Tax=Methylomonas sp. EFPC1 TaxID=2812647 RepID=UPI0019674C97|nr:hypothetical protein [Methylomonas sp. EFPC1]QSB03033.1 hypothetical protein JWZ98_08940 [Methylomonas sp. EFPC1]
MTSITDPIIWHPNRQELHLDLKRLLNIDSKLVLTGWHHPAGLSWWLCFVDGIEERHTNPFESLYFPIPEMLADDTAIHYLGIPAHLLSTSKRYRADSFGMLVCLSRHKSLVKTMGNNWTLFWKCYRQAKAELWTEQQLINVCNKGAVEMMHACHLPANQAAISTLTKFSADNFGQFQFDLIDHLFSELDYHQLNATHDIIFDHQVHFLLKYPHLEGLGVWRNWTSNNYDELLRTVKSIQALAQRPVLPAVNIQEQMQSCESLSALKTLQNALQDAKAQNELLNYDKPLESAYRASASFPPPPVTSTETFEAITTPSQLFQLSKSLNFNLMSYVQGINEGKYYLYRIKPDEAVVVLMLFKTNDNRVKPVIQSIIKKYGDLPNKSLMQSANKWIHTL